MQGLKAIETSYRGFMFRSRLEARWAVFFDALETEWEYEKEGFDLGNAGWYLPDFWIPSLEAWVEVKGSECSDAEKAKICDFRQSSSKPLFVVTGSIDHHQWECGSDLLCWPSVALFDRFFNLYYEKSSTVPLQCPFCFCRQLEPIRMGRNPVQSKSNASAYWQMKCSRGHEWKLKVRLDSDGFRAEICEFEASLARFFDFGLVVAQDRRSYDEAINAAKSARFEHGVSGALHRSQPRR